jgi:hypothetical protein
MRCCAQEEAMKKNILVLLMMSFATVGPFAEDVAQPPKVALGTNLAYWGLSAISTNGSNIFLVVPLEAQVMIGGALSVNPGLTFLYYGNSTNKYGGALILGECGLGYHFGKKGLSGWSAALSPGLAYSFDSKLFGFVLSAEAGYQWIVGEGLFLGLSGGGKYIWMDGYMVMPDLKLRIGYVF